MLFYSYLQYKKYTENSFSLEKNSRFVDSCLVFLTSDEQEQNINDNYKICFPQKIVCLFIVSIRKSEQQTNFHEKKKLKI